MSGGGQAGGPQPQMQPFGGPTGQLGGTSAPQSGALGRFNPTNPAGAPSQPSNPAGGGKGQSPQSAPNYGWNTNTLAPSNVQAQTPALYGGAWNQLSQQMAGPQYSPVPPAMGQNQYLGNPAAQTALGGSYVPQTAFGGLFGAANTQPLRGSQR